MKALKQHIFERLILSKTSRIPDGEFNINWATDSINKFKDYYKAMNEKHGFNLPDIAMTAKFRPIQVVYYDKLDPSDSDQNTFEWTIYKITENIKFSKLYDIIIKYFEDNTDLLDESLNERLVLSKNRNNVLKDDEKFVYDRKSGLINNGITFIYDYYLERVKIDGYKKLEDNDIIDVYFVGNTIYYKYKGKLTTYIMGEVKNGETFEEVYDKMIDHLKEYNISLLEQ